MTSNDTCCTIVPYLKIHSGKIQEFKTVAERLVEKTRSEPGCLYYGWSFNGDEAYCREGYHDADAALAHAQNVRDLLPELLKFSELTRFEVHGPESELAKLRGPLADRRPQYFTLEFGFRR
jgi:quinol monooxygenase YgiN